MHPHKCPKNVVVYEGIYFDETIAWSFAQEMMQPHRTLITAYTPTGTNPLQTSGHNAARRWVSGAINAVVRSVVADRREGSAGDNDTSSRPLVDLKGVPAACAKRCCGAMAQHAGCSL